MLRALIFDWGGTVMADSGEPGPMYLWKEVSWVPGARQALSQLTSYVRCIATNAGISDTTAMRKALVRVGAESCFDHFFSSKDLGYAKPDPMFFHVISKRIGIPPSDCIMIGNSYSKDICGAKRVGMRTVFYNPGHAQGPFPDADFVIHDLSLLPELIASLNRIQ